MEPTLTQQLIVAFHLEHLPPEEATSILDDAGIVIMNSVITRCIPLLDAVEATRCDELLASNAETIELFKFLKEKIPTFDAIVQEEIDLLKKTLS